MLLDKMTNPFILAPMAGITTMPFRRLMKKMGAGCVISEFVSAHAVVSKSPRSEQYLAFHPDERPFGIQLFGGDTEVLIKASQILEQRGVDFVDINLGCPVPKVTKKGGGSAWLCQPVELGQMLKKVRAAIGIPLTIKIRSGWDEKNVNAQEIIHIAAEEGVEWVAVHARTRMQGYAGLADWDLLRTLAQNSKIPIIGNGDIITGPLAAARLLQSKCSGVMIGRGALKNPWIFSEAVEALDKSAELSEEQKSDLINAVITHHRLPDTGSLPNGKNYYERKVKKLQPLPINFVAEWVRIRADRDATTLVNEHLALLRESYPETKVMFHFRKFLAWYSAGYPGSSLFRKYLFNTEDFQAIIDKSLDFFESVKQLGQKADEVRDEEPVLMGGHG